MREVQVDLTELACEGLGTGIQRVERELLRRRGDALTPVIFDRATERLLRMPERALHAVLAGARVRPEGFAPIAPGKILFNPELFHDAARGRFYRALVRKGARVKWLLYDFIPWLRPEFFPHRSRRHFMAYLRALREVREVAFISEATREDYRRAILRGTERDGPVVPLGGDGLGLPRQAFAPARRSFVVLGRVMARKNVPAILAAFEALWREGIEAPLVLLGGLDPAAHAERAAIARLQGAPHFSFVESPPDTRVREELSRARALIFASEAEGFGLPPLEALSAGIPVIAPSIPSLGLLPPLGQIRLARTDAAAIVGAVRRLTSDAEATLLWAEAAEVRVPTWEDFARTLLAWLQD